MTQALKARILERLEGLQMPDGNGSIVSRGIVSDVFVADRKAFFSLTVPAAEAERFEPLRLAAEEAAAGIEGVGSASVVLTAERVPGTASPRPSVPQSRSPAPPVQRARNREGKPGIPGVGRIVAVASGKGGVGKSTTAVNLALGLRTLGLAVGLLDADIYGPSVPRLLGLRGRPKSIGGKRLRPMRAHGLKAMSIGFLVEEEAPMIWRGPMVMSALTQMMREVEWGPLDILVVDMPPGTGDAQLTMAQQVPLAGAVIISTPQDLALIDARKGLAMFRKVDVPVLGIVENMSYFIAPDTGARYDIFGHGGARAEAERLGVPFLGEVPLVMAIRESSDAGMPVVAGEPDGPHAAAYRDIAARALAEMDSIGSARAAPAIVFE